MPGPPLPFTPPIVVLGATGHLGSGVAGSLLARGVPVRVVTRSAGRGAGWAARGAEVVVADLLDVDAWRSALRPGGRLFALNPPAAVTGDTDAAENATADAIVEAVRGVGGPGLDRVVALSTYGAQDGERIGDLGTLHRFERRLADATAGSTTTVCVLRVAYLYSNWDGVLAQARDGVLPTMTDPATRIPMVDPADVGSAAADLLLADEPPTLTNVEGSRTYSPAEVATIFAGVLGRPVAPVVTPRDRWVATFEEQGFSAAAAQSYAGMTAVLADGFEHPADPVRGSSTLEDYVARLAARPDPGHANQP